MDLDNATIRHTVSSIEFGFYTDDDIRQRSVCEIRSPVSYDSLGNVLPYGLYTPHLGPLHTKDGSCLTCGQLFSDCPGHCGHIELYLPVYHPLLFGTMYRLLKLKCLHCHQFRCKATTVKKHRIKLFLLKVGLLERALGLEDELMTKLRKSTSRGATTGTAAIRSRSGRKPLSSKSQDDGVDDYDEKNNNMIDAEFMDKALEDILQSINEEVKDMKEVKLSAHSRIIYKNLRKTILSDLVAPKCQNCGYVSNKLRKDGQGGGKIFKCVLNMKAKESNSELKFNAMAALELENRLADKDITVQEYTRRLSGGSALWRILSAEQNDDVDSDAEDDNYIDSTSKVDEYMNPLEIQAQMKLTWTLYPEFCSEVFGDGGLGYKVFFMNTICVPPSRFRPPMTLGSITAEHAQNAHFEKLLKYNIEIRKLKAIYSSNSSGADNGMSLSEKGENAIDSTSKILQHWISLQNAINLLVSDEKDGNGIRQILERKEGMFRK